jgi:hypothetical protein
MERAIPIHGESMKLNFEVRLHAPAEVVAAVLTSAKDAPAWQEGLVEMEVVRGGPNQVGALARLHYVEDARSFVMQDELLECSPGRRWKSRVSGSGMTVLVETALEDAEGDTLLRMSWNGRPDARWARLFFPFLGPVLRKRITSDLESLQRLVLNRAEDGMN